MDKKHNHFMPKLTWRIIRSYTPFNTTKENAICVSMKSFKSLHTKKTTYWTKGQNINKRRHQNSPAFYSMIAKTRSSLFNWNTSCRISTGAPVLACMINVLHNMLFKTKIEQLKTVVLFENIGGNISCECDTEMMSPFRLDTIYSTIIFPLYVTIFWLKIA